MYLTQLIIAIAINLQNSITSIAIYKAIKKPTRTLVM